jgi:poly-gamma-glutamate synthesis protein (capsule biosynthesis protein)
LWTENDTAEIDRKREPSRRPAIRVVAVDRALAHVRGELARFPADVPAERRADWVRLRRREALLAARRAASTSVLGEDLARTLLPGELEAPRVPGASATSTVAR